MRMLVLKLLTFKKVKLIFGHPVYYRVLFVAENFIPYKNVFVFSSQIFINYCKTVLISMCVELVKESENFTCLIVI